MKKEETKKTGRMIFNIKSTIAFILIIAGASFVCFLMQKISLSDLYVPLVFEFAVLLVALTTDGYFYGILAAVISVFGVNWAFTYPYMKLDFSIYGYPLTFITMLAVGLIVSTLVSRLKLQEKIQLESEREKMRSNLLRSISHDLRTPLTSISGTVSMVLENDGLDSKQKKELLLGVKENADWLYRMVENLLSITKMNSNMAEINKNSEVPEEIISEVISKFAKMNPDIKIEVKLPEVFFFVPMDAMLIEQVLINLLDNAVIHGKTTSRIFIEVEKRKNDVIFSVSDNGCGINEDLTSHLFDGSIHLSGNSINDENKFIGIGLMVCNTIVNAHGGKMYAENLPQGGAKFSFTLSLEA